MHALTVSVQRAHSQDTALALTYVLKCLRRVYMWCEAAVTVKTIRCRVSAEAWWGGGIPE